VAFQVIWRVYGVESVVKFNFALGMSPGGVFDGFVVFMSVIHKF
jgi:hypothetical protein